MYVNFFCFVLFSFIRGKGGRQLRPSLSGTVGGVTSPYTNTPFLEKNYMEKKKGKKTIHTHAVRLAIPGKKIHGKKKGKKTIHTHPTYIPVCMYIPVCVIVCVYIPVERR
jgi:hypothetical protein